MNPLILIQARLGGTRFPGKVREPVGHTTMWGQVRFRVSHIAFTQMLWAEDFPGLDENDVLGRFYEGIQRSEYDPIVRITADCPLIDPGLVRYALSLYVKYDINVFTDPSWDGTDVEVMDRKCLEEAHRNAVQPYEREHVTTWIRNHDPVVRIPLEGPALRWSVDTPEALEWVRTVYAACEHCASGQPHRFREGRPIWDIHDVYGLHDGGAPEPMCCEAYDLLMERRQEEPYVSK